MSLTRLAVAPMVKVTTPAFLHLMGLVCPQHVDLYTEMKHARQVLKEPTTEGLSRLFGPPDQAGLVVQLGGSDPAQLGDATAKLAEAGYQRVNLNCGCPSKNVQAGSFGAVLMKDADLVGRILERMQTSSSSSGHAVRLSVKCRVGVDEHDSPGFLHHFLRTILAASPNLENITVHARKAWLSGVSPKDNRRIPELQHDRVYGLKKALGPSLPPLWTNGGVESVEEAKAHLEHVDGVMIGRKVQSSPMFMADCVQGIHGGDFPFIPQILRSYTNYAESKLEMKDRVGPSAHCILRPAILLYPGSPGRVFRSRIQEYLKGWSRDQGAQGLRLAMEEAILMATERQEEVQRVMEGRVKAASGDEMELPLRAASLSS